MILNYKFEDLNRLKNYKKSIRSMKENTLNNNQLNIVLKPSDFQIYSFIMEFY